MSKRLIASAALMAAFLLTTTVNSADKDAKKAKEFKCKCPVSGKPAIKDSHVAYRKAKVYFCCPGCPKAFKEKTAKFAAKANHQLVVTGQFEQVKCPIANKKIRKCRSSLTA
jgi:hypothetical protein